MTTPHRFLAGAIDLGEVKAQAELRRTAANTSSIPTTVTLTMDNVEEELIKRSAQVPVIVLIGTPRSPDSEQLKADFEQLAYKAQRRFVFAYINADETPDVARMFGIQGLPTVVALASGQPIANFEGGQPREALQQWSEAVINAVGDQLLGAEEEQPEDPRFAPATDALNRGDFQAAIDVYEEILAQEPKNLMAAQARDNARLLHRLQQAESDVDPIANAAANPTDIDAQFAAADAEIAAGAPTAAFDRLINVLALDKETVRRRLVELFALFDPTDPIVVEARSKMASALY
ncbi:MAG: tetratricopeptide repeat protein [Corynebacterium sp.]|uniref:tetratricopeptide repeat protein n=1 Tax=Corynebacterium sp. TaxID=1720 RepID=UPI0026DABE9B|nr:tetratricopeptide repeat protein [Corynebacterium sp.]MDO4760547.1 tetratricopeptide repeat protein [Corynebacterium sp.]